VNAGLCAEKRFMEFIIKYKIIQFICLFVITLLLIYFQEIKKPNKDSNFNDLRKKITEARTLRAKMIEKRDFNEITQNLKKYLSRWEKEQYVKIDNPEEYWGNYWGDRIGGNNADGKFFYFEITDKVVPVFRELNLKTILCVGNGVSLEPLALAHAGFNVDVLDISKQAMSFISNYNLTESDINRFYNGKEYRSGGTLRFIVGDFTDKSVCSGPYDVIITKRTLQYFTRCNFLEVIDCLIERLNYNGILISHTHNAYDVNNAIEEYLCLKEFISFKPDMNLKEINNEKRIIWLFGSSG
jgi:hypothetical protein